MAVRSHLAFVYVMACTERVIEIKAMNTVVIVLVAEMK